MTIERPTVLVDRATYERILTAAINTGHILTHSKEHADAGLMNILVWPTIDADSPIILIASES